MNRYVALAISLSACLVSLTLRKFTGQAFWYYAFLTALPFFFCNIALLALGAKNPLQPNRSVQKWMAFGLMALYGGVFITMTLNRYAAFSTQMYDLGNLDIALWNMAESVRQGGIAGLFSHQALSRFDAHVEPLYWLFGLQYLLWPDPRGPILFQTAAIIVFLAGTYLLAMEILQNRVKALIVMGAMAAFPPLEFANLFDVHGDVFALPCLIFAVLFSLRKQWGRYWIALLLGLACKEYVGLAAAGFGISLFHAQKQKLQGILTTIAGLAYFLLAMLVIIPLHNHGQDSSVIGVDFSGIGGREGLGGMVRFGLSNPLALIKHCATAGNGESLFYLFFPLFFLPLFRIWYMAGAFLIIVKDLLFGINLWTHHLALAIPFIAYALIMTLDALPRNGVVVLTRIFRPASRSLYVLVLGATLVSAFSYGPSPLGHRFWREIAIYVPDNHDAAALAISKKIPVNKRVSISERMASHASHQRSCDIFPSPFYEINAASGPVDFVCIDTTDSDCRDRRWGNSGISQLDTLRASGYVSTDSLDGIYLFAFSGPAACRTAANRPPNRY